MDKKHMEEKFKSVLDKLYNTSAYLALMLDPRYKLQITPENIDIEMTKQILVDEFDNYQILEQSFSNDEIDNNSSMGDKRKQLGILDRILQKKKESSSNLQLHSEVDEYLTASTEPLNTNPCEWWKNHQLQYPILSKIARDYIGIPSTSVPSEQAFSKSGELISKRRNRLSDNAIEACMCLNSWMKLLND